MGVRRSSGTRFTPTGELSRRAAAREVDALREEIGRHDYLYYVRNAPRISDAAYDRLFGRLQELEAAFPSLRTKDSPTSRVGAAPVSRLRKVGHAVPMLSLDAVHEEAGVRTFCEAARAAANVSREVDYLVVGKNPGAKLARARTLGVTLLSEEAFRSLIGDD